MRDPTPLVRGPTRPLHAARAGRLAGALVLLCVTLCVLPSGAWADEATPLARLSASERAALEQRIPGLSGLPREKQELIVRNVERLRGLDPAQRALVEQRFKAARAAGLGGQDLAERGLSWQRLGGSKQTLAEWQGRVMKALGWRAWQELPVGLREHPAVAPLLARAWPVAFHQRYLAKAVATLDAETAKGWQPPEPLPPAWKERFVKEREQLLEGLQGNGSERALLQLKKLVLQGRALEAVREAFSVPVAGGDTPAARLQLLGERLGALTGPAFAETVAELVALAARLGPEAFAAQVRELAEPPKPPPELQRKIDALQVVVALESWRAWIAAHPALAPQADALLRAALVDDLGMPSATFEQLPAREAPGEVPGEARSKALRAWVEEALPRELRRHLLPGRWGGERRAGWLGGPGGWRNR